MALEGVEYVWIPPSSSLGGDLGYRYRNFLSLLDGLFDLHSRIVYAALGREVREVSEGETCQGWADCVRKSLPVSFRPVKSGAGHGHVFDLTGDVPFSENGCVI